VGRRPFSRWGSFKPDQTEFESPAIQPSGEVERRPYASPQLTVHGCVADLTKDLPDAKVGGSDIK
jgi:hypothetical protein